MIGRKWFREKINPIDIMKSFWPGIDLSHIEYCPNMLKKDGDVNQYYIVRQSSHDGTHCFSQELLILALEGLVYKFSCHKSQNDIICSGVKYKIGPVKSLGIFGRVNLPCGRFPGVRQRVRILVQSEPTYE